MPAPNTRSVSVIGLGTMGSTLAQRFLGAGLKVTVWNRTAGKAGPLVAKGASQAATAAAAISASPLTIICVLDYAAVSEVLGSKDVSASASGRCLVNLTTGDAKRAHQTAAWASVAGAAYIDGGIMGHPRDIGESHTVILYSGNEEAFRKHESTLSLLAGSPRFLGPDPGSAATLYCALWMHYFAALGSFFEATRLAETGGTSIEAFAELVNDVVGPTLTHGIADAARRVTSNQFAGYQAPVDNYASGLPMLIDELAVQELPGVAVGSFYEYVKRAQAAGFGQQDIATLYKVAR